MSIYNGLAKCATQLTDWDQKQIIRAAVFRLRQQGGEGQLQLADMAMRAFNGETIDRNNLGQYGDD